MVATIDSFLSVLVSYVWGLPLVIILAGSGLLFSILLRGVQLRGFCHAIKVIIGRYDRQEDPGQITHFQALSTALSATVGLGNIAGVAIAIKAGGPGATFWMIVIGLLGMATKYAECTLSMMYRRIDDHGKVLGGPIQYIVHGLKPHWRFLAVFFAIASVIGGLGIGNLFQIYHTANILHSSFFIPPIATGLIAAFVMGFVIIGGIKRIALVTSYLVPLMGSIYVLAALTVILINIQQIPSIFMQIISDAFTGTAAVGGFTGVVFAEVIKQGTRRACFSNEAGLGSAPIAHAAASTKEPVREGVVALLEPFIDTVVICTMTALVILISGYWTSDVEGLELTKMAFDFSLPGFGSYILPIIAALFAFSTALSWSYYGEVSITYLFSRLKNTNKWVVAYKVFFCIVIVIGSVWSSTPVTNFSDTMLGLMVIPNLIAVWLLFPQLRIATNKYFQRLHNKEF